MYLDKSTSMSISPRQSGGLGVLSSVCYSRHCEACVSRVDGSRKRHFQFGNVDRRLLAGVRSTRLWSINPKILSLAAFWTPWLLYAQCGISLTWQEVKVAA